MSIKETVQTMIDCNAGMVFYYTHSKPELKRMVHPILIVNNHVVCVESDTGKHKRFKLDGIKFPVDEVQEIISDFEELSTDDDDIEDIINEHIKENKPLTFTYTHNSPYEHRYNKVYTVEPSIIKDDLLITREFHDGANNFFVKYIRPFALSAHKQSECKKVGSERSESPSGNEVRRTECEGCVNELANQQGHMGINGCISEERKIVGVRHFHDCGFGFNLETMSCDCCETGAAYVWYNDGTRKILNNM
jgi:hypothetical protein